jgi:hypothetical protein
LALIFQIHPLIANFDEKKAFHPVTTGLFIEPKREGNKMVTKTPANWPRKDRDTLWVELFQAVDKLGHELIPKEEIQDSVVLKVNAELKVPAARWHPQMRSDKIKEITETLARAGVLQSIAVAPVADGAGKPGAESCAICGWTHDAGFTQIVTGEGDPIFLRGACSEIARLVHLAHERGLPSLSTKDQDLLNACGGYHHPCKAYGDLKRQAEYKRLFDTSRRGCITLRGVIGRNRNQSQTRPE